MKTTTLLSALIIAFGLNLGAAQDSAQAGRHRFRGPHHRRRLGHNLSPLLKRWTTRATSSASTWT